MGALNPKTPEQERRSRTEPILGWCCSLGAQPGASRELLLPHRAQLCSAPLSGLGHRALGAAHTLQPQLGSFPLCAAFREGRNRDHTPSIIHPSIPRGLEGPSGRTDSCFSSPSLTFQENPSYKGDVAEPKAAPTVSRTAAAAAPTTPALSQGLKSREMPQNRAP